MDLIKEINDKYLALEAEIDKKMEKVEAEEQKLEHQNIRLAEKSAHTQPSKVLSYEEALLRNTNTLKSLEIAKARLRSRSTYSPVEKLLQEAIDNYKTELKSTQPPNEERSSGQDSAEDPEDEDECDKLYELVMKNVFEASSGKGNPESRRQH